MGIRENAEHFFICDNGNKLRRKGTMFVLDFGTKLSRHRYSPCLIVIASSEKVTRGLIHDHD